MQPQDLLRFGLIPEFVGRLPVIASLYELDEDALIRILTEPKNALIKQYMKFFEFENVHLKFTPESLRAIARQALDRETGARGLRSILESVMLDIMYEIPSQNSIVECEINEDVIVKGKTVATAFEAAAGELGLHLAPVTPVVEPAQGAIRLALRQIRGK